MIEYIDIVDYIDAIKSYQEIFCDRKMSLGPPTIGLHRTRASLCKCMFVDVDNDDPSSSYYRGHKFLVWTPAKRSYFIRKNGQWSVAHSVICARATVCCGIIFFLESFFCIHLSPSSLHAQRKRIYLTAYQQEMISFAGFVINEWTSFLPLRFRADNLFKTAPASTLS